MHVPQSIIWKSYIIYKKINELIFLGLRNESAVVNSFSFSVWSFDRTISILNVGFTISTVTRSCKWWTSNNAAWNVFHVFGHIYQSLVIFISLIFVKSKSCLAWNVTKETKSHISGIGIVLIIYIHCFLFGSSAFLWTNLNRFFFHFLW